MARLKVDTTAIRRCAKCGRTEPPLFRHHKGNDGGLSQYNVNIAKNYDKYLDCCDLCMDCHVEIHWLYCTRILSLWVNRTSRGASHTRKRCIKLCDQWLAGRDFRRNLPVPGEFRTEFMRRHSEWRKSGGLTAQQRTEAAKIRRELNLLARKRSEA